MEHYKITFDTLIIIVPKVIIEQLIFQYIDSYKYTIKTPELFDDIHYNKYFGLIYCASEYEYKLINYNTGTMHDSSKISIRSLNEIFDIDNIITYFDIYDTIAISKTGRLTNHYLHNK
jgi:hypothetical protein